jgi:predicted transcriptional regulator of viral defense system
MRRGRCDPLEHMRALVLKAKGNVVTLKLKTLCGERRAALALLKMLADAGYLRRIGDGKYLLQRGSPLWEALERGEAARLLEQLYSSRLPRPNSRKQL